MALDRVLILDLDPRSSPRSTRSRAEIFPVAGMNSVAASASAAGAPPAHAGGGAVPAPRPRGHRRLRHRLRSRPPRRRHEQVHELPGGLPAAPLRPGACHDAFGLHNPGQFSSVLRRYSDFLWLFEWLHRERAGAIVPPLPEKQAVARFSPEFVEERRAALQRFLRRVVLHPELWDAECLLTFLRADDAGFRHAKNTSKAEDNAKQNASNLGGDGSGMMG